MVIEGYVGLDREDRNASRDRASRMPAAITWAEEHKGHDLREPLVEGLLMRGVRVTFRCACGGSCEVWT